MAEPPPATSRSIAVIREPELPADQDLQASLDRYLAESDLLDAEQAREQRRTYARRIFRLVLGWLVLVGYVVLSQGFGFGVPGGFWWIPILPFSLSDSVLIALLTTTTVTVVGVLAIVLNHLFPNARRR